MKIEKGNTYKCIKTISTGINGHPEFIEGNIYLSEFYGHLTNELGNKYHSINGEFADKHFDLYKDRVKIPSFQKDKHHNNINKPILIFTFPRASQEFGNDIKNILKDQGVYDNYSVLIKGAMTSDKESVVIINLDGTINKVEF